MHKDIFSEEVKVFTPDSFVDYRGEYWTTWKKGILKKTRSQVIKELKKWSGKLIETEYTKNIY